MFEPYTILVSNYLIVFKHYMLVLPSSNGVLFIHNTPFGGVQISNDLGSRTITATIKIQFTEDEKKAIQERAEFSAHHKFKYDLFLFNCEHFINWVLTGCIHQSNQVEKVKAFLNRIT